MRDKLLFLFVLGDLPFVPGAAGLAMSNPPLLSTMGLFTSLEVCDYAGVFIIGVCHLDF